MNSRKKILFLITKSNFGGAQRHVFDLATNLPKEKYDVVVALGAGGLLKTKLEAAGIRVITIPSLQRNIKLFVELVSLFQVFYIIKRERPNIVHSHSSKAGGLGSFAGFLFRLLLKLQPTAYKLQVIIFTVHGWPFKEKRSKWWRFNARMFSWLTIILADKTITVSEEDESWAKDFVGVGKKSVLIHNGVDNISFDGRKKARETILPAIKSSAAEIWIGTIAELHKNKGLDFAIRAFADLSRADKTIFVIIGEGEERQNLEKLIADLKLSDRVFLAGHIDDAAKYLKAFDIFTLTSEKEGLPYTILEAGRAGLPVVASNVGGIPEIISDMSSGILVKPSRSSEIKKALEYLLEHPDRGREFGEALSKNVAENFSLEQMIKETEKVYES